MFATPGGSIQYSIESIERVPADQSLEEKGAERNAALGGLSQRSKGSCFCLRVPTA